MASEALLLKRNEGYRVSFNPSNASEEAVLTIVFIGRLSSPGSLKGSRVLVKEVDPIKKGFDIQPK